MYDWFNLYSLAPTSMSFDMLLCVFVLMFFVLSCLLVKLTCWPVMPIKILNLVKYLAHRSLDNINRNMGKMLKLGMRWKIFLMTLLIRVFFSDDDKQRTYEIIELLMIRQDHHELDILDQSEIQQIFEYPCNWGFYAHMHYFALYSLLCVFIYLHTNKCYMYNNFQQWGIIS